ncbi:unnamed protein product [Gadus morhua 'NCC']
MGAMMGALRDPWQSELQQTSINVRQGESCPGYSSGHNTVEPLAYNKPKRSSSRQVSLRDSPDVVCCRLSVQLV